MSTDREYVLGTGRDELERLGLQHSVWRARAHAHWERAGFAAGKRLLDVGCGPGFATLDLAAIVGPSGRVTAIDVSRRFLSHLEQEARGLEQVRVVEADVQRLALEPASADGAWSRWVFSFVPDPEAVIAGVARALAPGARWAIQEYCCYEMRIGPEGGPALRRVLEAIGRSWRAQGGEPDIALRLPVLLERAGFEVVEADAITRLARPGSLAWDWPGSFFEAYVPKLAASGHLDEGEARDFLDVWRARSRDSGSLFVCPTVAAITAVKK